MDKLKIKLNYMSTHSNNFWVFFLFFQIYDANNERYEVPIATPKVETQATTLDYDVSVSPFPFGVSVKRKSTGTVM